MRINAKNTLEKLKNTLLVPFQVFTYEKLPILLFIV